MKKVRKKLFPNMEKFKEDFLRGKGRVGILKKFKKREENKSNKWKWAAVILLVIIYFIYFYFFKK